MACLPGCAIGLKQPPFAHAAVFVPASIDAPGVAPHDYILKLAFTTRNVQLILRT